MWNAKITQITREGRGDYTAVITFDDGVDKFDESYSLSANRDLNSLQKLVKNKILTLNTIKTFVSTLVVGDEISPSPDDQPPTQEQIEKQEFISDYNLLQRVQRAIDIGLLTGNEAQVVALKTKVQNEFKPTYLNIL